MFRIIEIRTLVFDSTDVIIFFFIELEVSSIASGSFTGSRTSASGSSPIVVSSIGSVGASMFGASSMIVLRLLHSFLDLFEFDLHLRDQRASISQCQPHARLHRVSCDTLCCVECLLLSEIEPRCTNVHRWQFSVKPESLRSESKTFNLFDIRVATSSGFVSGWKCGQDAPQSHPGCKF